MPFIGASLVAIKSATSCREEYMEVDGKLTDHLKTEFPEDKLWICPKLKEFNLLNDPWLFPLGASAERS